MNIIFCVTGLSKSGAETQLLYLSRGLIARGHRVSIIALVDGDLKNDFIKAGASVHVAPDISQGMSVLGKIKHLPNLVSFMVKSINSIGPDIVHSFLAHTNILLLLAYAVRPKRFKIVTSYRIVITRHIPLLLAELPVHWRSDYATTNSKTGEKALWMSRLFGVPTMTIYNGFISRSIDQDGLDKLRAQYEGKKIVLTVARFNEQKDYATNVETAQKVINQQPDVLFVYVGEGPQKQRFQKYVSDHGLDQSIYFLGKRNDVPELMQLADVFFLPTKYESQANVLMEAMYYGVAIVTSDIPENRELLEGGLSALSQVGDSELFAEKIIEALGADPGPEVELNKKSVMEKCQAENMISSYEQIYESLV